MQSQPLRIVRAAFLALAVAATSVVPAFAADPAPPAPEVPPALNLYLPGAFRYQDPNYAACTSTSAMFMLNLIALHGTGGSDFRWTVTKDYAVRDRILAWSRAHDTLVGGTGTDPHGWRNALNHYGWGDGRLGASTRIYDDRAYTSYQGAVKAAVRALIQHRKPVGILAWSGKHAQVIHGYDGLVGDPFAVDAEGRYTNEFTVAAVYLSDPLKAQAMVNARVRYTDLRNTTNLKLRYTRYTETDSPLDDPYTSGWRRSRDEWYGKWVTIMPIR